MGNAHVPPGCQRAPARLVTKLGEEGADGTAGGTRGPPPQFGAGCGLHGGPDTGYVAKLGDGPNPERTTSPSLTELNASLPSAAVSASKFGEVDVTAPGRRSNVGNEGCCAGPTAVQQEKVPPCEHDSGHVSVGCPAGLRVEDRNVSLGPGAGTIPEGDKYHSKFDSWDFPFEAQPTLMLARFKALPARGRRPQAPGDQVAHADDHEFGWLGALLGGEAPCSAATLLGVGCCSVGPEALAGSKATLRTLGSNAG